MSIQTMSAAWQFSSAKGGALLVMLALGDMADANDGVAWPSEKRLAEMARMDERNVRRALNALREAGELEVWEWRDEVSGDRKNAYRILLGDWAELRGQPPGEILIRARGGSVKHKISTGQRKRIMERDQHTCRCCGAKVRLSIDHIVAVTKGGSDDDVNLQVLCTPCNTSKSDGACCRLHVATGQNVRQVPDAGVRQVPDAGVRQVPDAGVRSHARVPLLEPSVEPSKAPPSSPPRKRWQVDHAPVSAEHDKLAHAILACWNDVAEQQLRSKEWLAKIVMRLREFPDLGLAEHERIIRHCLAHPWWRGHPMPSVIYGNGAQFERQLTEAAKGAKGTSQSAFEIALAALRERDAS